MHRLPFLRTILRRRAFHVLAAVGLIVCLGAPARSWGQANTEERRKEKEQRNAAAKELADRYAKQAQVLEAAQKEEQNRQRTVQKQVEELKQVPAEVLILRNTAQIAAVFFDPLDVVARVGEAFATDVVLRCQAQRAFTNVNVLIAYDPRCLKPLEVHDDALRPLLDGLPEFQSGNGRLRYTAQTRSPVDFFSQRLLTIIWEPLRPVQNTRVELATADQRTSVRAGGAELLTGELMPNGALLPLDVSIQPRMAGYKQGFMNLGPGGALNAPGFVKGPIWLELAGPQAPVPAHTEFDVRVQLHNPDSTQFDTVTLVIRYPPSKASVLDWDVGNWIRAGINIHDAPAHEIFPFDFHALNEVDLEHGEIRYRMGMTRRPLTTEGLLAEFRVRAAEPISVRDIKFELQPDATGIATDITFLGASLLENTPARQIAK